MTGELAVDVADLLKIAGIGFLVAVAYHVLEKSGRSEQAMLVSVGGMITVLVLIVREIGGLLSAIRTIFGI